MPLSALFTHRLLLGTLVAVGSRQTPCHYFSGNVGGDASPRVVGLLLVRAAERVDKASPYVDYNELSRYIKISWMMMT